MPRRALGRLWERIQGAGVGARLLRGASTFLLIQVLGVGVAFASQVVLARVLGTESFGVFSVAYSWTVVALIVCRLGLVTGALRFVPMYESTARYGLLHGFLRTSQRAVLAVSLVTACGMALIVELLGERVSRELAVTLWVATLTLPLQAILQLFGSTLRGFKQVTMSQLPESVVQPLSLLALVALIAFGIGIPVEAPGAMGAFGASVAVALILSGAVFVRSVPDEVRRAAPETDVPEWWRVAWPLLLINGLNVVQQRTDVLVIGSIVSSTDAGIYAAAARVANVIPFGLAAVNAWAAPHFSEFHARGQRAELRRVVRVAGLTILAFTLPIAGTALVAGHYLLGLFGPGFEGGYSCLAILAVGQIVNALTGPVGFLMTMTGHQSEALRIQAFHSVANVILNLVLVPRLGIEGAAIATGLTQTSRNVWMAVIVWKRLGVRATFF